MIDMLIVIAEHRVMGEIHRSRRRTRRGPVDELRFIYDSDWLSWADAYPLSVQMPFYQISHEHDAIAPWLRGILPDDHEVLARWGAEFEVSPGDTLGLLAVIGEDCPGAIQLVHPTRVAKVLQDDRERAQWLSEEEVATRLRILGQQKAAWRLAGDIGRFSLAGYQPKTALLYDGRRWGVPSGRTPTTHILKPPNPPYDGLVENEHLCLKLAGDLGLTAAKSDVQTFGREKAIVVTRFDRRPRPDGSIRRLHQEDFCQALGVGTDKKYQNEGGPSCKEICDVLWEHSSDPDSDVREFANAILLNWIVVGTDAHAKNYSVRLGRREHVRLAPFYDIASFLPHADHLKAIAMSQKVGGKYRVQDVRARHWDRFAEEVRLPPNDVIEAGLSMTAALPSKLQAIVADMRDRGLDHPVLKTLTTKLNDRASNCAQILRRRSLPDWSRRPY